MVNWNGLINLYYKVTHKTSDSRMQHGLMQRNNKKVFQRSKPKGFQLKIIQKAMMDTI